MPPRNKPEAEGKESDSLKEILGDVFQELGQDSKEHTEKIARLIESGDFDEAASQVRELSERLPHSAVSTASQIAQVAEILEYGASLKNVVDGVIEDDQQKIQDNLLDALGPAAVEGGAYLLGGLHGAVIAGVTAYAGDQLAEAHSEYLHNRDEVPVEASADDRMEAHKKHVALKEQLEDKIEQWENAGKSPMEVFKLAYEELYSPKYLNTYQELYPNDDEGWVKQAVRDVEWMKGEVFDKIDENRDGLIDKREEQLKYKKTTSSNEDMMPGAAIATLQDGPVEAVEEDEVTIRNTRISSSDDDEGEEAEDA